MAGEAACSGSPIVSVWLAREKLSSDLERLTVFAMNENYNLVIVGGGIAGLEIATALGRRFRRDQSVTVTLVDNGLAHVWKPTLHTVAAGTSYSDRQKIEYIAQAHQNGFVFAAGSLAKVDRHAQEVVIASVVHSDDGTRIESTDSRRLRYDTLVIAVGSRANDFGVPGVVAHCMPIDDTTTGALFPAGLASSCAGCDAGRR